MKRIQILHIVEGKLKHPTTILVFGKPSHKFLNVCGGHLISMNILPRKEDGSYTYSLWVGGRVGIRCFSLFKE
jgi:hypothetical protein